jgi:agmatine/peptidylarginine deiminase
MKKDICLPAEWADQDAVMLTWPNAGTDWAAILDEAEATYLSIAREIIKRQQLLVVCDDQSRVASYFSTAELRSVRFFELPFNDTWARDHGPIITFSEGQAIVNDFGFNGWGNKFDAQLDDQITSGLFSNRAFKEVVGYRDYRDFILEGGSIESDGLGTILTTGACLLNPNRNPQLSKTDIEGKLRAVLGAERILWVMHGHLEGDDTDSHIDTLARFCDESTIAYVQCTDPGDAHYRELHLMEEELKGFRKTSGEPYRLVPLPMVSPLYNEEGERMGATYANFLIINQAVLVPVYGTPEDQQALEIIAGIFPGREVVGINCLPLIKQNGSLHCITMQIPKGVLL